MTAASRPDWWDARLIWFLPAMAFITYILLAGMALGIQKRSALLPLLSSPDSLCVTRVKSCVLCVCVKVQPRGSGTVCEHRPRVGCHRGLGNAVEFVPADGSQRPLHLWPHCLQWIQICWVNITFYPLRVRLKPWLHIESTLKCSLPLFQDHIHHVMWPPVRQWWLFCGTSLVLLCPDVLHCKYLEQGCPGFMVRQGPIVQPASN